MTTARTRLATGVFAVMMALAVFSVSTAHAEEEGPLSTTCGAGTVTLCGSQPIESCSWVFDISIDRNTGFHIKIGRTDCKVIGSVPIYKDLEANSLLSQSCFFLSPFTRLPEGSGCS